MVVVAVAVGIDHRHLNDTKSSVGATKDAATGMARIPTVTTAIELRRTEIPMKGVMTRPEKTEKSLLVRKMAKSKV